MHSILSVVSIAMKTFVLVLSFIAAAAAFTGNDINYHLFTRPAGSPSEVLNPQQPATIASSDFNPSRPTKVLIHGAEGMGDLQFLTHVVNGFLTASDVNIIVVDWNAGTHETFYTIGLVNSGTAASGAISFLQFLISNFQLQVGQLHLVGFNIGAHVAGTIARNLPGTVSYLTALDPALHGWTHHPLRLTSTDAAVVEALHTNANVNGFGRPVGTIDFFANDGVNQPGCSSSLCSHRLSFVFFGEALVNEASGLSNFVGSACADAAEALSGSCSGDSQLTFGTLAPKLGISGIYQFATNPASPHAQG